MSIDTFLGIVGIVVAFGLYYFDLKKKLDALKMTLDEVLQRSEGILSKQQAHDLIDLYLDAVDTHIELSIKRYSENDLVRHYDLKSYDSIHNEFIRAYDQIVKKQIRKMVSSFLLRGNHRVDSIIQNISQDRVNCTMQAIVKTFVSAREVDTPLRDVIPKVLLLSRGANAEGKILIAAEVDKYYPSRAA